MVNALQRIWTCAMGLIVMGAIIWGVHWLFDVEGPISNSLVWVLLWFWIGERYDEYRKRNGPC
jgi:hypothetical protein